jgi:VCBS repeat-containing protein
MSSESSNSIPIIGGWATGSVYEDQLFNGYLTAFNALTIADPDPGQSSFAPQSATAGTYGTFTLGANGVWTYTADNSQTAIQQLGWGQTLTDSFTAVSMDGSASQLVTVTILGTNDVPVIGGVSTGSVTEDVNVTDGKLTTGGALTISDVDEGQSSFTPQASAHAFYGTFTLTANGAWTYSADNSQMLIQQLGAGQSVSDSFYAASSDGSGGQLVTVTINGAHDDPVIQGGTTGSVYEDLAVSGGNLTTLNAIWVVGDQGQSRFAAQTSTSGTYGTFTLGWNGSWTYTADDSQAAIQQLGAGQSLTDSFTAVSIDGTLSVPVTVTIHGMNDVPVIGGVSTGSVTEDVNVSGGNLTAGGALTISDVDHGQSSFAPQTRAAGFYGTFTLAGNGAWTYTANNSQRSIQQLGPGQSVTDSFTAFSSDASASQLVTVTINGTHDDPVVQGGTTGSVFEDHANVSNNLTTQGIISVLGDLSASTFVAQAHAAGTYGTFALAADGGWTYTADNSQTVIQRLGLGQTLTDTFTAVSAGGTLHTPVTVTIYGTNDVPVIGGTSTGVVNEVRNLQGASLSASGILTITDPDQGESRFFFPHMVMPGSNHYGTFTFDASGAWSYTLDSSQTAVRQLGPGQSLQDSFSDLSYDGSVSQLVTVTINGTNHASIPHDFNADGSSDILWRNSSTGDIGAWQIANGAASWLPLGSATGDWQVLGTADFNNDGAADILWRNTNTGDVGAWQILNGHPSWLALGNAVSPWQYEGTGDFNGDGTSDILWRNTATGDVGAWQITDGHAGWLALGNAVSPWQFEGIGDFNGDGTSDILWRNTASGEVGAWQITNGHAGWLPLGDASSDWRVLGTGDFNGDGVSDILWRNSNSGDVGAWQMANGHPSWLALGNAVSPWQFQEIGDFNHDGTSDILWRNSSTLDVGAWQISNGHASWLPLGNGISPWEIVGA